MFVPVTNDDGQFHGLRAGGAGRLRRLVQPTGQLFGILRVVVQVVQVHQQQRVHGGAWTESDVHAKDDLHEKKLKLSHAYVLHTTFQLSCTFRCNIFKKKNAVLSPQYLVLVRTNTHEFKNMAQFPWPPPSS